MMAFMVIIMYTYIFLKINLLHKSTRKENLLKETSMEIARMLMHKKISEADFRRKLSSIVRKKR